MKKFALIVIFTSLFTSSLGANVLDDLIIKKIPLINGLIIELLKRGMTDNTENNNPELAKEICLAGGVSPRICTGGTYAYEKNLNPKNIQQAVEMVPYVDRTYWWDRFKDQYGNYQWRCRGGQTKQFAENSNCSGVNKDDDRWPG